MMRWSALAGCDKSLPGLMMAMVRLNVPSRCSCMAARLCPGNSTSAKNRDGSGCIRGRRPACGGEIFGRRFGPRWSRSRARSSGVVWWPVYSEYDGLRRRRRSVWRCPVQQRGACALFDSRDAYRVCQRGAQVLNLFETQEHSPTRYLLRAKSLDQRGPRWWRRPAARPTARCTCQRWPTRPGLDFDLFDVAEAFKSTPYIADLKPAAAMSRRTCTRPAGSIC